MIFPASGTFCRFIVNIAWMTTLGSESFDHCAVVGGERLVARLIEGLARTNRLDAHLRIGTLHQLAHELRVERVETLERPHRVDARELVR